MKRVFWLLTCVLFLISCNKDKEFVIVKPSITFDNTHGIYTVKTGSELTISPEFDNLGDDGSVVWIMDGSTVANGPAFSRVWTVAGTYYVTIKATNAAGTTSEEIRIEVTDPEPPIIEMGPYRNAIQILVNSDYTFTPEISGADTIEWLLDGKKVCNTSVYVFHVTETGSYNLEVKASNNDGTTTATTKIEVVETLPYHVYFTTPSLRYDTTTRYTFAGRSVCLYPMIENIDNATYIWKVDGKMIDCTDHLCVFTPDKAGQYNVTVSVTSGDRQAHASVNVICVEATETQRMRQVSLSSRQCQTEVMEYVPAPGQFINENMTASTQAEANAWATDQLNKNYAISLGACGGYVTVGFDHSIPSGNQEYDFVISSNAITTSNEPGIIWVMQDVNGNGLPDDEWYELRGSETGRATTLQHYAVTYFKPTSNRTAILWTDNYGHTGSIPVNSFHTQSSYYPAWIGTSSYTLYGTCLGARNVEDTSTGYWDNKPYDWGYADNIGNDNLTSDSWPGTGQRNGFKISNAIYSNGTAVTLKYIDFIKVTTGVNTVSGMIGEISTEVSGFYDCSIK